MRDFFARRLSPFKHLHFRNFYIVQALSQTGKWSHDLARSWLILELVDNKAWALGLVVLMAAIPNIILSLPSGVLVDRVNVKKVLLLTNSVLALSALCLAFIVEFYQVQLWHLIIFGIIEGSVASFSGPAFQVLTLRLVPKSEFTPTLLLNTMNFHMGRAIGPGVAALLMYWYGTSLVFLFDAITYVVLLLILSKVQLFQRPQSSLQQTSFAALLEGMKYLFSTLSLRFRLIQLFLSVILFLPLSIVLYRTYLKIKFQLTPDQFGLLFSFSASGAFVGALIFVLISPKNPMKYLWASVPLVTLTIFTVPSLTSLKLTAIALFFGGVFAYICFSAITVSLHTYVNDIYRGRLSSIVSLCFISVGPLACYPVGVFADKYGYDTCIYILGGAFFLFSTLLALRHHHLKSVSRPAATT